MYSSVVPLSDGDALHASYLNQLADNAAFLAGLAGQINIPFVGETTEAGANFTYRYRIRHLHRYLHVQITQDVSADDNLDIKYNGTTVYNDGGDRSSPYTWQIVVDLQDTGVISPTPTIGDWYEVYASISQDTGSGVSTLVYILESPESSL